LSKKLFGGGELPKGEREKEEKLKKKEKGGPTKDKGE
jgi:hypothetical protein